MSKVLLEKYDGYAMVILNRPDSMNALSRALREEFVAVFEECQRDEANHCPGRQLVQGDQLAQK